MSAKDNHQTKSGAANDVNSDTPPLKQMRDIMGASDTEAREISDKCALQFREIMRNREGE